MFSRSTIFSFTLKYSLVAWGLKPWPDFSDLAPYWCRPAQQCCWLAVEEVPRSTASSG